MFHSQVAQSVERHSVKVRVAGSNPALGAKKEMPYKPGEACTAKDLAAGHDQLAESLCSSNRAPSLTGCSSAW